MKIAVSIPDAVFEAAERLAKERRVPRSQVFAEALAEYVARHRPEAVTEKLDAVYRVEESGMDEALLRAQVSVLDDEAW